MIFVYEYITVHQHQFDFPPSLIREGGAMFDAIRHDLASIPGVEVSVLSEADLADEQAAIRSMARDAEFCLIIAPEFDGLLAERCRWVEEAGGRLLGPSSLAVELTGDKLRLAEHWQEHGVTTPPTEQVAYARRTVDYPRVMKPRYGAGSQDTRRIEAGQPLDGRGEMIVQPFVPGEPVSIAFLIGPNETIPLPPTRQHIASDGSFAYEGGELPLPNDLTERVVTLATSAIASVTGLFGYVGVDAILGETDVAIEINPRVTTSYVGLRALAEFNLAEWLLQIVRGERLRPGRWKTGPLQFTPGGVVTSRLA